MEIDLGSVNRKAIRVKVAYLPSNPVGDLILRTWLVMPFYETAVGLAVCSRPKPYAATLPVEEAVCGLEVSAVDNENLDVVQRLLVCGRMSLTDCA